MANRNFNRLQALEKEVKQLHAVVSIAGSGAPTLTQGLGITSIARNSAGLYTITLNDKYMSLRNVSIVQQAASAEDLQFQIAAEDVASAKTIQVRCVAAGVVADPSNGSKLFITLELKNSSV